MYASIQIENKNGMFTTLELYDLSNPREQHRYEQHKRGDHPAIRLARKLGLNLYTAESENLGAVQNIGGIGSLTRSQLVKI